MAVRSVGTRAVTSTRVVAVATLAPAPLVGTSAPTTVPTTSMATIPYSVAAVVAAILAAASARVAVPTRAPVGASVAMATTATTTATTTASATVASAPAAAVAVPSVVVAPGGERSSLLVFPVLWRGGLEHHHGARGVRCPQGRHQPQHQLRQTPSLPAVFSAQEPCRVNRKEAFLRKLQQ